MHQQGGPDDAGHTVLLPVPDAGVFADMHCGLVWGVEDGGSDEAWAGVRQHGVEVGGHGLAAGGRACSPPSGAPARGAWHDAVPSGGHETRVDAPMPCPSRGVAYKTLQTDVVSRYPARQGCSGPLRMKDCSRFYICNVHISSGSMAGPAHVAADGCCYCGHRGYVPGV